MKQITILIVLMCALSACIEMQNKFTGLAPGMWRGHLVLDEIPFTEDPEKLGIGDITQGELPFNFEVIYENDTTFYIEIINGSERIRVDDIYIGRNRAIARDTVEIRFPIYESYINAQFEAERINGYWIVENREDYKIPFVARFGQGHRFTNLRKTPVADLTGRWEATFEIDQDTPYPAIGDFVQTGNRLEGTFMTETGDYRYLQGTIQANKFYMSCFDGAHAFLFTGKIQEDGNLIGTFSSGKHYATVWEASRNPNASLPDPNKLTFLKKGYDKVDFSFPDTKGNMVSINDDVYKGKPKIVQIFGTWCPNCRDETSFLSDYLKNNDTKDLEVFALAYEKRKDPSKAFAAIQRYKEHFDVPYPILLAGPSDKIRAAETLPMLNHILSYPTLIFIDRNDNVTNIHTGFNGPATNEYEYFKKDFEENLKSILSE